MYVTTFYSFKGGVGRTMALVNVAVELANRGKQVLALDFDLEAPGLDTFDLGRPSEKQPGILDFVEYYLNTGRAPNVEDYVFECPDVGTDGGGLWVMPSGARDDAYPNRLAAMDWNDLYEHHDGFLLFEDLKLQWEKDLQVDYALVDSRTGYTDVGGICTCHLPNAVVTLFFPNDQNLRGLATVVQDVRAEAEEPDGQHIDLHFVFSNVPDLDDEDEILDRKIDEFRSQLQFDRDPLFIHRYPSLSLLNQAIFTKDRPKSRLANEYRQLVTEITRLNPEDRDGALEYVRSFSSRRQFLRPVHQSARHLEQIEKHHAADGEVLFHLARLRERQGDLDDSGKLLDGAIEAGYRSPAAWLQRARHRRLHLDDRAGASEDALQALQSEEARFPEVSEALRFLAPNDLKKAAGSPVTQALSARERQSLAMRHPRSSQGAELAIELLQPILATSELEDGELDMARQAAILAFLAAGRFAEAAEICEHAAASVETMSVQHAFNYGMARWAQRQEPPREPFARVVELDSAAPPDRANANYAQCLALAHWVTGAIDAAKEALSLAESRIQVERSSFSCWRYLDVPARAFLDDLREMRQLFDGDRTMTPRFMRSATQEAKAASTSE